MRRQKKPCPGCGAVDRERKSDQVCSDCAHAIKKWNEHVAASEKRKDLTTVGLKGAAHWYPQFYFGGPRAHIEGLDETRSEIARLFWELGRAMAVADLDWKDVSSTHKVLPLYFMPDVREPLRKGESYRKRLEYPTSEGNGSVDSYGKIDTQALEILRKLWDHAARFAEMAYLGGVQDGRSFVFQIAQGEMTVSDLQKEDVRLGAEFQNAAKLHRKMKGKTIASFAK